MIRPLKVVPSKVASAPTPRADITTSLFDYNFKLSSHVRAGTHTIRVHNTGPQVHEVELVRLAPGKTVEDFVAWLGDMKGPPPAKPIGGSPRSSRECRNYLQPISRRETMRSSALFLTQKMESHTTRTE